MFEDDVYDQRDGRWAVQPVKGLEGESLRVLYYHIMDTESDTPLNAEYAKREDAAEVCGILNQYEVEIAALRAQRDNGQHGVGSNGA